jgi:hypothetical protein
MTSLATAEELQTYLGIETIEETRAELLLSAVSYEIKNFTRNTFEVFEDQQLVLDGTGTKILRLPCLEIIDITEVLEDNELLESTAYEIDNISHLRRIDGNVWQARGRYYKVTLSFGSVCPDEVKLICLRAAARGYVNPNALGSETVGNYAASFAPESRLISLSDAEKDQLRAYAI